MTSSSRQLDSPAEIKSDPTICGYSQNTTEANTNSGEKIYSKVLTMQAMAMMVKPLNWIAAIELVNLD
jgi:hypothetical protein